VQGSPKLSIIGVPTNSSGRSNGVAKAPNAIRRAGLIQAFRHYCETYDQGDVTFIQPIVRRDHNSGIIGYDSFISMVQAVYKSVNSALKHHRFPIVIGGDCPILLGCLAAVREIHGSSSGLLFVDGHEDAYPPHKSPTGEAADMELGFALGMNCERLQSNIVHNNSYWPPLPLVDANKVCMLGTRDRKMLQKQGVESLSRKAVKTFYDDIAIRKSKNVEALISRELKQLGSKIAADRLWLHLDLDVLSTSAMSAVDYQQPGGINWTQLEKITNAIMSSGSTIGLDLTIYNPDLDPDGRFAKRIVSYLQYAVSILS
jgi:arginase